MLIKTKYNIKEEFNSNINNISILINNKIINIIKIIEYE